LYTFLIPYVHASCPNYFILHDLINCTIFGEVYKSWSS
jgi:hypothetical protein